jgi:hypothetical protein
VILLGTGSRPKKKKTVHGQYLFFPRQRENLSQTQLYCYHKSVKEIDQSSRDMGKEVVVLSWGKQARPQMMMNSSDTPNLLFDALLIINVIPSPLF